MDCLTCGALLSTCDSIPELCTYCGADPRCRPHALECTHVSAEDAGLCNTDDMRYYRHRRSGKSA
jgi:hypothetical protein